MVMDVLAIAMEPAPARKQRTCTVCGGTRLTQRGSTFSARQTMSTARNEHHDYMVAHLEIIHARSKLLHHASGLVTKHHRGRARSITVDDGEIGMAETRRADLHHHFVVLGIVQVELFDRQWLRFLIRRLGAHFVEDCGSYFHWQRPELGSAEAERYPTPEVSYVRRARLSVLLEAPDCFSPALLKFGERLLARVHHVLPCGLIRSANLVGHLGSLFGFGLHLLHGLLIVVASLLAHLLKTFLIVLHLCHPDVALSLQLVGEVLLHHVGSPSHTRLVTQFPARVLVTLPPARACSRRSRWAL